MFRYMRSNSILATFFLIALLGLMPCATSFARASQLPTDGDKADASLVSAVTDEAFRLYQADGQMRARLVGHDQAMPILYRDANQTIHTISPVRTHSQTGLKLVFRTTAQLESYPEAKAAFLRAAATWEEWIQTPISVIIDLDYGPLCFGNEVSAEEKGFTNPQLLIGRGLFPKTFTRMLEDADDEEEAALYWALPRNVLPTTEGETNSIIAPSAMFRVFRHIDPIAGEFEPVIWGPPPALWLNTGQNYDFNVADGIDEGKIDFEGVVLRELGRILGFYSAVGRLDENPDELLAASIWDFFRMRPGVVMDSFPTERRILTPGGLQAFNCGHNDLLLSTGGLDEASGDGRSASHWKDDILTGTRIGIMDPTIPEGKHHTVTLNDLSALNAMGYSIRPVGNNKPTLTNLTADLHGDVLSFRGISTDADGDVVQAQVRLLNEKEQLVAESAPFAVDFGVPEVLPFTMDFRGLSGFPSVIKVALSLIDSKGNRSNAITVGFSKGDESGPTLKSAVYKKGKLTISGKGFSGDVQVEINGVVVNPAGGFKIKVKKITATAEANELRLQGGANRIRVIVNGLRSNIVQEEL